MTTKAALTSFSGNKDNLRTVYSRCSRRSECMDTPLDNVLKFLHLRSEIQRIDSSGIPFVLCGSNTGMVLVEIREPFCFVLLTFYINPGHAGGFLVCRVLLFSSVLFCLVLFMTLFRTILFGVLFCSALNSSLFFSFGLCSL